MGGRLVRHQSGIAGKSRHAGLNATTQTVNAPGAGTYYWRVDSYLDGSATGSPLTGSVFSFAVYDSDSDGDGAGDWYEIAATETDPTDPVDRPVIPYPLPDPDDSTGATDKPVKVYILSGQSNMVGMGNIDGAQPGTLETISKRENKFPNLVDDAGEWSVRHDVTYKGVVTATGQGPLRAGIQGGTIGPETGFGHVMGYHHDEPVLIIKTSQGNRSIGWDFPPPGSPQHIVDDYTYAGYGDSPDRWLTETTPDPIDWYAGKQYDDCFNAAHDVLDNFATNSPAYAAQGYEIAGFAWWQGHKDQYSAVHADRYELNLTKLITTLRTEFDAPNAPFVVATIGFNGEPYDPDSAYGKIRAAQMAAADPAKHPEFIGNVMTMDTLGYWRSIEESPVNQDYHYNRNAETFMLVGDALGRAMVELLDSGSGDDYGTWAAQFTGSDLSDPNADLDLDGLTNDEERIWGLDPTSGASASPISTPLEKTSGIFAYTRRLPSMTGLSYRYEWSTTLEEDNWTPLAPDREDTNGGNPVETGHVTVPAALLENTQLFVRAVAD